MELRTERTVLRQWCDDDFAAFAELNADVEVMEFFPSVLSHDDSDAFARRIKNEIDDTGRGLWALEVDGWFAGYVGTTFVTFDGPLNGRTEIGWRLARWAWGHGYASEAATAVLDDVFGRCGVDSVVSFTTTTNVRSRAVMARIGMTRREDLDFDHPRTPGWWGAPHVVYEVVPSRSPS